MRALPATAMLAGSLLASAQGSDTLPTVHTLFSSTLTGGGTGQTSAVASVEVTYVTSVPTVYADAWWVTILLVVGVCSLTAMCVCPICYFYKGRRQRGQELAIRAEINKSMREMTARLYRTRQLQYAKGVDISAMQLQSIGRQAGECGQEGLKEGRREPLLQADTIEAVSSPLRGNAAVTFVQQRRQSGEAPSAQLSGTRAATLGEAAVQDSNGGGMPKQSSSNFTQADMHHIDSKDHSNGPAPLGWGTVDESTASSSSLASCVKRNASVCVLATAPASTRSFASRPSRMQLTRATSVRAFSGLNKVDALRRVLGGPQLHPLPSARASMSPTFSRWNSTCSSRSIAPGAAVGGDFPAGRRRHGSAGVRGSFARFSSALDCTGNSPPFAPTPPPLLGNAMTKSLETYVFMQRAGGGARDSEDDSVKESHLDADGAVTEVSSNAMHNDRVEDEATAAMQRCKRDAVSSEVEQVHVPGDSEAAAAEAVPATTATAPVGEVPVQRGCEEALRFQGVINESHLPPLIKSSALPSAVSGAAALSEEQEEETAPSSESFRFVVPRRGLGRRSRGVEHRSTSVDHAGHEEKDRGESTGDIPTGVEGEGVQHVLSQIHRLRRGRDYIEPLPLPTHPSQYCVSPLRRLSLDDEYSQIMGSQFKQLL
ncbi:hypothetical protein ABL78_6000 [Leptomonas seymouri]|uniref:Integral membrane protein n=1 Tax=Leptomonas seymouri TaxID=5684 RepID=A0A0N0P4L3_LEPSE|nr:hypothetical protein ABL78_6000 [Leptomonas seymouri]|eukprot:KPI84957.1 hypothetical protein ABL78_6000 [Leptomonas seymouri]